MPFIGQQPTTGAFLELDSLTASATADYTLQLNGANYYPESVNNLLVSINGVIQGSSTMSLSGSTLTVGATLSSSDVIDFVRVFGNVGTISTPTDGSVTANKIGTGAVTSAKLDTNIAISGTLDVTGDTTLSGSVTGGGIDLIETKTISSTVSELIFTNKISATYNDYIVKGNYVNNTNHQLFVYLQDSGGDISSGTVYQSAEAGRAGSSAYSGNGASATQNFVYFPMVNSHYGGTVASFEMEFRNLYTGSVSGTTTISPHRSRNGTFNTQGQNVSSSDWFYTQGGFTYLQTSTTAVPTVTGIKFKVGAGDFANGYISLYGVKK